MLGEHVSSVTYQISLLYGQQCSQTSLFFYYLASSGASLARTEAGCV